MERGECGRYRDNVKCGIDQIGYGVRGGASCAAAAAFTFSVGAKFGGRLGTFGEAHS